MNIKNVLFLLPLVFPGLSWASVEQVPEPSILPLLLVGGVVALAVKFMGRKR